MNRNLSSMEKSMEKLSEDAIADFKEVVADTEALLKATANQGGEKLAEVRAKAEASLGIVKDLMRHTDADLRVKTRAAAKATDAYVHDNPWKVIGAVAGAFLVIGLFLDRR